MIVCAFVVTPHKQHEVKAEPTTKVGVVASHFSELYPYIERPGGTYQGQTVVPKGLTSSVKNKRIKMKVMLEKLGYDVEYVNDQQLKDAKALAKFDTLVFPNTVMMSYEQRGAVKQYIKDGGGAIMAFAFARNESARFPHKETEMDITALIYDTKTWVWEWDNVSEVLQSGFVNDVVIGNYEMTNASNHPIIQETLKAHGKTSLQIENNRMEKFHYSGDWIEVIKPYPNSKVTPLLHYNKIGFSSVREHTPVNTGAAYAIEYGKGKAVWIGFSLIDYLEVASQGSTEWEMTSPKGIKEVTNKAWEGLVGGEQLQTFIQKSVDWTAAKKSTYQPTDQNTTIALTNVRAYPRSADYIVYGTMTAKNKGNIVSRGTMKAEIINPSGKVIKTYEKYVVGIEPNKSSYPEQLQLSLPKNLAPGQYTFRVTYQSGKQGKKQRTISGDQYTLTIPKSTQTANITKPTFNDVPSSHWAHHDVMQMYYSNVVKGSSGIFRPEYKTTRLEAATVLVNALNLSTVNRPNPNLRDMKPGQLGYDIVATVVDAGIFSGSNGKFNPTSYLTREQMAKILVNAFELTGSEQLPFKDIKQDQWSKEYISTLLANKVTTPNTEYRPSQHTSNAQFISFVRRSLIAGVK